MLNIAPENTVTFTDGQYAVQIDKTSSSYLAAQAMGYNSWVEDARQFLEHYVLAGMTVQEALDKINEGATWAHLYEVDRSTVSYAAQG